MISFLLVSLGHLKPWLQGLEFDCRRIIITAHILPYENFYCFFQAHSKMNDIYIIFGTEDRIEMEKISIILLVSCLLGSVTMIFSAEYQKGINLINEHTLHLKNDETTWTCWHGHPQSSFATNLIVATPEMSHDNLYPLISLAKFLQKNDKYSKTNQTLPIINIDLTSHHPCDENQFTVKTKVNTIILVKNVDPKGPSTEISATAEYDFFYNQALLKEELCNIFVSDCSKLTFMCNSQAIAIIGLQGRRDSIIQWLEKRKNSTKDELLLQKPQTMKSIIPYLETQQKKALQKETLQPKEKTSFFTLWIGGIITGMFMLYTASKLECWNKNLALSMEAKLSSLFTHFSHDCQNMFSCIYQNTHSRT